MGFINKLKKAEQTTLSRKSEAQHSLTPPKLQLLITVIGREKAQLYLALIQGFDVNMQLSMAAKGTASTEMLHYLGLSDSNKTVIFSVIREDRAADALRYLDDKFATIKDGKGIAFTVPLTGVIGVAIYQFLSDNRR